MKRRVQSRPGVRQENRFLSLPSRFDQGKDGKDRRRFFYFSRYLDSTRLFILPLVLGLDALRLNLNSILSFFFTSPACGPTLP